MRCFTFFFFFWRGVLSVQNLIGVVDFTHLDSNQPHAKCSEPHVADGVHVNQCAEEKRKESLQILLQSHRLSYTITAF